MSYRRLPHGSTPPPLPPPPLPPPLPPHILPPPPLPHQPHPLPYRQPLPPPLPLPHHHDSAPPPIPMGPPPPPPPSHSPPPRLPAEPPPHQLQPPIPSLMDLDFSRKASPSNTAPEQQPSVPGRSHSGSVQEVRPPGPVPAQSSGSPQHYGKDYERFEHVRDQPPLVGHASSYQQGANHRTYPPPWQQPQPQSQPQHERQQQSQTGSIHPWTRAEQNQDSASSYAHSHCSVAGCGMEQNQPPTTNSISNSNHPPDSSYEELPSGFGSRGQQEQESSSHHDDQDGRQCLFPWFSEGHSESRGPLEHRSQQEQGQTPGLYGSRFPSVLGEHSRDSPLAPSDSEHQDRYGGQREEDQPPDYSNRYPPVEGREGAHTRNSSRRLQEHHDTYSRTEERRPADYPGDRYLTPSEREFEHTAAQRESPLGQPFREGDPYERNREYRQEQYDEQQFQRTGRPDKPALLPTPPQPPDYTADYGYEELHVREERLDYQRSPRRLPDCEQPYHPHHRPRPPDDYRSGSPEMLSERWRPDGRERFRDPAPKVLTSQGRSSPPANSSALEHRHPENRLTDHERPDYREPDSWQEPGALESNSGGFGSYRDDGEWGGERDLDRARQHDYNREGPLVRHDPYHHHPPREFQHDPHFQGDRFDEPRGHSPRPPPRGGDASMYHHQPHHEDNFRRPYDEFHHHRPEVNERVRDEIPQGAGMVGQFFRPEVKTIQAEKIFDSPGRGDRPSHIVIILRGLPGSGKSHIARLIREKEVSSGGAPPRVLSLDPYFMTEVEKVEKDPDTGRRVKKKVEEYEYDDAMEPNYRASLFKLFNKTLTEGFFPMIVVDATNHKVHHFDRFWSSAKMKGFEVYVVELIESIDLCVERNVHQRTREEIQKLALQWEETPPHFTRLDVTSLLSDSNIDEVEMECTDSDEESSQNTQQDNQDQQAPLVKSRWEDASEDTLDKLDGFRRRKRFRSESSDDGQELSLTEYLGRRELEGSSHTTSASGRKKKRVRWADLEAEKEEKLKREIGFCIGSTWSKVSEEEAETILRGGTAASTVADEQD